MLDSFLVLSATKDTTAVERANLLNMAKLSIKGLIESALSFGRTLDSDYPPLQQFFVVMEHCLKHGLKGTGKFLKNQLGSGPPPILNILKNVIFFFEAIITVTLKMLGGWVFGENTLLLYISSWVVFRKSLVFCKKLFDLNFFLSIL